MRSLARHQCVTTVQLAVFIVFLLVVEFIVAQRGVDDVHAHAVGKLNCGRPVVLLHQVLGIIVLAAQQPVGSLGSGTHHHLRTVQPHTRPYGHTVALLGKDVGTGVDKVLCTQHTVHIEGCDAVGVVITRVDDGNDHPLSAETRLVQFVAMTQLNLCSACTVVTLWILLGAVHQRIALGRHHLLGRAHPYPFGGAYERQGGDTADGRRIVARHRHEVLPLARHHDVHSLPPYLVHIASTHRQVGRVHLQSLAVAALQSLRGQKFLRTLQGVLRSRLVLQADAILQRVLLCTRRQDGQDANQ